MLYFCILADWLKSNEFAKLMIGNEAVVGSLDRLTRVFAMINCLFLFTDELCSIY
jgi:hypothetical protein